MTQLYNDTYVIKQVRDESMTEVDAQLEIEGFAGRAVMHSRRRVDLTARPDGLEVGGRSRALADHLIDNTRINREGRIDAYLDCDPARSNLPAPS